MMSLYFGIQKPNGPQILQQSLVLNNQPHKIFANSVFKEANVKFGLLSNMPTQMSHSEKITETDLHLQQPSQFPNVNVDGLQTATEDQHQEPNEGPETETEKASEPLLVPETVPFLLPSSSATRSPVTAAVTNRTNQHTLPAVTFPPTSPPYHTKSDLLTGRRGSGFQHQPQSVDKQEPTHTSSPAALSSSHIPPTSSATTSQSSSITQPPPLNHTTTESGAQWPGSQDPAMNTTSTRLLSRSLSRPVCPYPPVPAHGTFYIRNAKNSGPRELRHYIEYACYPGYTLADGDVHSYCLQGAWSGVTPACLGRCCYCLIGKDDK